MRYPAECICMGSRIPHISHFSNSSGHCPIFITCRLDYSLCPGKVRCYGCPGFGHLPHLKVKRIGSITKREATCWTKELTITQTTKDPFFDIKYENQLPSLPNIKECHKIYVKSMGLYLYLYCVIKHSSIVLFCVYGIAGLF